MNKQAAYDLGVALAMRDAGLVKEAGLKTEALMQLLPHAGAGAVLGGGAGALMSEDPLQGALLGAGIGAGAGGGLSGLHLLRKALKDRAIRGTAKEIVKGQTARGAQAAEELGYKGVSPSIHSTEGKRRLRETAKSRQAVLEETRANAAKEHGGYGGSGLGIPKAGPKR